MAALHRLATGLALLAIGTSAAAQTQIGGGPSDPRDSRVQIGVIVPLGSAGSKAERAPRVELWSDRRSQSERVRPRLRLDSSAPTVRPVRLGVTLQQHPQMTLNGREVPRQNDRQGVSALGWVGIGVGVVVLTVVVFTATGGFDPLTN